MSGSTDLDDLLAAALGDDEDAAWQAVMSLHQRGDIATLEAARARLDDPDPRVRCRAADVLGQLGVPERTFPAACFDALAERLAREDHPAVLGDLGIALGHLGDPRAVPLLVPLAGHAAAEVRYGVVAGIMAQDDPAALATLIALSTDPDLDVRDWATFALGSQTEADTPALRAALCARLADEDATVRMEAIVGLAARGDATAVPALIAAFTAGELSAELVEAAASLGDPRLQPALRTLRAHPDATAYFEEVLDEALHRCDPDLDA